MTLLQNLRGMNCDSPIGDCQNLQTASLSTTDTQAPSYHPESVAELFFFWISLKTGSFSDCLANGFQQSSEMRYMLTPKSKGVPKALCLTLSVRRGQMQQIFLHPGNMIQITGPQELPRARSDRPLNFCVWDLFLIIWHISVKSTSCSSKLIIMISSM